MIDRRSSTDHPPSLSGMDYVLEGASVRDRFLTAFILQHHGALISDWPQAAGLPDDSPSFDVSVLFPGPEQKELGIQAERPCEPLMVQVIGEWFGTDDDDM